MNIRLFGACAVLSCAMGFAGAAHAVTETITFSGPTNYGVFSGSATLDVENGVAVSGTGSITGTDLGTESLDLITSLTPGAEIAGDGSFGYRSNGGDDVGGYTDAESNNFLFALGPNAPTPNGNLVFGIYDAGGGNYVSELYGVSSNGTRFYEDQSASFTSTVSAAPEPSTWLLMVVGVGGIGLVTRRAKKSIGSSFGTTLAT